MKLCQIGQTEIKINYSFFVCVFLWVISGNVVPLFCLTTAVLLHECAHAVTAAMLKKQVNSIELYIFGGAARIDGLDDAASEIIIALAGPLWSFACGYIFSQFGKIFPQELVKYSYSVAMFNLIPAYPLDGGRIFASVSEMLFSGGEKIAKRISVAIAALICAYGVYQAVKGISDNCFVMGVFILTASIQSLKQPKNVFLRKNNSNDVQIIKAGESETVLAVSKRISGRKYCLISVCDSQGRLKFIIDEYTLRESMIKNPLMQMRALRDLCIY